MKANREKKSKNAVKRKLVKKIRAMLDSYPFGIQRYYVRKAIFQGSVPSQYFVEISSPIIDTTLTCAVISTRGTGTVKSMPSADFLLQRLIHKLSFELGAI